MTVMKWPTYTDKGKEKGVREQIWFNKSENPHKTKWLSKRTAAVIIYQLHRRKNYYRTTTTQNSTVSKQEIPNSELFYVIELSHDADLKCTMNECFKFL
jgi:hypothetical protein